MAPRLRASALASVLVLLITTFATAAITRGPAAAAPETISGTTGNIWGVIVGRHGDTPKVAIKIFTVDWDYIRQVKASHGSYSIDLPPGTYRLQFVDRRPAYDTGKYAPTDRKVKVGSGSKAGPTVRMAPGGYFYGTVTANKKASKRALVRAVNSYGQTYETKANKKGQFALGGLPKSTYWVYTYDHKNQWVGKPVTVENVTPGDGFGVYPTLNTPAGRLLVRVSTAEGDRVDKVAATVVSKKTGQYWVTNGRRGLFSFAGLYPGRYTIEVQGYGNFLGAKGRVIGAKVKGKPNYVAVGRFKLTKRGGSVAGRVVDIATGTPLAGAQVRLYGADGDQIVEVTTKSDGEFFLGGRLLSQSGLSVVAQPNFGLNGSNYLGEEPNRCEFGRVETSSFSVKTGQQHDVGDIELPRVGPSSNPQCVTRSSSSPTSSPTASPTASASASTSPSASTSASATTSPSASAGAN